MRSTAAVRPLALVAGIALAACADGGEVTAPVETAPVFAVGGQQQRYIVVFHSDVEDPDALTEQVTRGLGAQVHHRYRHALKGFAATLPVEALEGVRRNPRVAYIEPDQVITLEATQNNATWGLDRIDQRDRPLNSTYVYDATGAGVRAYIIDTGLRYSHADFSGRAAFGYDAFGGDGSDCNGHGTHVGGTVGGETWGVAKDVALYAVRVLNCNGSGTTSGVIAGIDWVRGNAVKPAVANMSLGGGASTALDNAVANAVNAGITFVVAAGNNSRNACNYSPARASSAITVGATTSSDSRASYSNYGSCLDLFAPGSSITSAWYTGNAATATISGTSMASPHVAGVAALYLDENASASPATVTSAILGAASTGKVSSAGTGSPNRLLYSLFGSTPEPEPDEPPPSGSISLTSSTSTSGPNWTATVHVNAGAGVTVSGTWSTGDGGNCTTSASGTCSIVGESLHKKVASTTFTVTSPTPGPSITISKP